MKLREKFKKINVSKLLFNFVLITMLVSIVGLIIIMIKAPSVSTDIGVKVKSDYTLILTQNILGVVVLFIPSIIAKKFKMELPSNIMILYIIFLYAAIVLGETKGYYYKIAHWDDILHCFSGAMLGALGFSVVSLLNRTDRIPMNLSPSFVSIFAFCFALSLGVFWEIYEYSMDGLLNMNMQKTMLEDGTKLMGHLAVEDTMNDLMIDALGASIMCFMGYISLKYGTAFVHKFQFKKIKEK